MTPRGTSLALIADAALLVVFATIGRASHDEALTVGGIAHTSWPFLVGMTIGWVLVALRGRSPLSLTSGIAIWVVTVVAAMVLRQVSDQGTDPAFIVVATVVTGFFLLGWRLVARAARRR